MDEAGLALILSTQADPALIDAISANFVAHSASKGLASDFRSLNIRAERAGVLLGGLAGRTGRGWLYIEFLSLPMAEQGSGIGRRLVAAAEQEATRRGCVGAFLNTFAFQAPGFYRRLGYQEFARLAHDDPQQTRIWFQKRWQ